MRASKAAVVAFRVTASGGVPRVDVSLSDAGDRWIALVETDGRRETGIGSTARLALSAALTPLGGCARGAVLADPALLAPSVQLADPAPEA